MDHPPTPPLVIGLHVTKCAGTSLVTTLRRHLPEDHYHFCSSYYENLLVGRPLLCEIIAQHRLRVIFGHFCHENLLSAFRNRRIILISGLRDPLRRTISHFHQVNAVRFTAGLRLVTAREFLAGGAGASTICSEVLRCFPSLDEASDAPPWIKAAGALSMFDYLYSTEDFRNDARHVLAIFGLEHVEPVRDNASEAKDLPPQVAETIEQQSHLIAAEFDQFLDQDAKLYHALQPYLSRPDLQKEQAFHGEPWRTDRVRCLERLPPPEEALRAYAEFECNNLAYEFASLGRRAELVRHIDERMNRWHSIRQSATALSTSEDASELSFGRIAAIPDTWVAPEDGGLPDKALAISARLGAMMEELVAIRTELLERRRHTELLQQRLLPLLTRPLAGPLSKLLAPDDEITPGIRVSFEPTARVELTLTPTADKGAPREAGGNVLRLSLQPPGAWLSIEAALSWPQVMYARWYEFGLGARSNRKARCRILIRCYQDARHDDTPLGELSLDPGETSYKGGGEIALPQLAPDAKAAFIAIFYPAGPATDGEAALDVGLDAISLHVA